MGGLFQFANKSNQAVLFSCVNVILPFNDDGSSINKVGSCSKLNNPSRLVWRSGGAAAWDVVCSFSVSVSMIAGDSVAVAATVASSVSGGFCGSFGSALSIVSSSFCF